MRKLTFDSIMSFYEKHNRSVYQRIVQAQRNGTLSPFVGAGLSVPFGYKQWGGVLRELADNIMDEDKKTLVLDQINAGKYEKASGTILEEYPFMLDQFPDIVSPDILKNCPEDKKRSSAAWVLPYLFQRELVMTTNFDRVLEECYLSHKNKPIPTVTPVNRDRLAQLQLNQELCLLTLHGDIGKEAVSIDDLVFTEDQYKEHYAEGSPLVSVLERRFTNRRMLFLGCSLSSDRTMKVLGQVVKTQKGIRHFAILGCKKSEIQKRAKDLASLGILPIFYDDSNHDAVRVILDQLLHDTDRSAHRQLHASQPTAIKAISPLMFYSNFFSFAGRKEELQALDAFCDAAPNPLWWAVTGPGGMGKSRLVYEFTRRKENDGWNILWYDRDHLPLLKADPLPTRNTIIVLDDVQIHSEIVTNWLIQLATDQPSARLRVLLLERDGKNLDSAIWLHQAPYDMTLSSILYQQEFLYLKPMHTADLAELMTNYANAMDSSIDANALLAILKNADPALMRPMYAVAITEAKCRGKNLIGWSGNEALDFLLNLELKLYFDRLRGLTGKQVKGQLQSELEDLMATSCVRGSLPLDQVSLVSKPAIQKLLTKESLELTELFQQMGICTAVPFPHVSILDNDNKPFNIDLQYTESICLTFPDLLKERLVFRRTFGNGNKYNPDILFEEGWDDNPFAMVLLMQLCTKYKMTLSSHNSFFSKILEAQPQKTFSLILYSLLLTIIQFTYPQYSAQIQEKHATQNLDQSMKKFEAVLEELEESSTAPDIQAPMLALYASNLVAEMSRRPPSEQHHTLKKLRQLYQKQPTSEPVAVSFSAGLSISLHSHFPNMEAFDELEQLYRSHKSAGDVAINFASTLRHIAFRQTTELEVRDTLARSKAILDQHPGNADIQCIYAETWFNLTLVQQETDIPATAKDIAAFLRNHPDIIPEFREDLDTYLSEHPDHAVRYQPLLELGGDGHA